MHSTRLFHELKTFIWHNGKPQAMRSYHDDLVMALAIGCWVETQPCRPTKWRSNTKSYAWWHNEVRDKNEYTD